MAAFETKMQRAMKNRFCLGLSREDDNVTLKKAFVGCDEEVETEMYNSQILPYCMIISVIFLFLTGTIYAALPTLRDLQGKSIVSFCLCLGIALSLLIVMELLEYADYDLCTARGFFTYYFLTAAFFWMNAISIQILKSVRNSSISTYRWVDYVWYGVYAWGTPAVLTLILAILNYLPGEHPRPGIGLNTCWFFNIERQWIYLYSVMTILVLANIGIFAYISYILCRNSFSSTHVKSLKYKFNMTCKLSIVMGLPWIFEMINSLLPNFFFTLFFDIFNTLQGFFIFLVLVVFRVRVLKALHRHNLLCCMTGYVESKLATKDDHEEEIIHTIAVPLDDKNNTQTYTS